ncbi:sporulation protein YjcZ [Bacillus cereus]|nr:sporulation protein YjcZ [Bacillus cereus]PER32984.1 sporulation protein YjcZ [Bacillus cereus]
MSNYKRDWLLFHTKNILYIVVHELYRLTFSKGGKHMSYGGSCAGFGGGFALLIVLFILLIIIGCSCWGGGGFGY